jgi:hypothetical protein
MLTLSKVARRIKTQLKGNNFKVRKIHFTKKKKKFVFHIEILRTAN